MDECENFIKEGWNRSFGSTKIYHIIQKLSNCKRLLVEWSNKAVPNNTKVIEELIKKAEVLQGNNVSALEFGEMRNISKNLNEAWEREEIYWHQRAKKKLVE